MQKCAVRCVGHQPVRVYATAAIIFGEHSSIQILSGAAAWRPLSFQTQVLTCHEDLPTFVPPSVVCLLWNVSIMRTH